MSIKRYFSNSDTTITNAYQSNMSTKGTGSNMGAADVLETFMIYGQVSGASGLEPELARALVQFPVSDISTDRTDGKIPASGSISFYLKLYNVEHARTTPKNFDLVVNAISSEWQEGVGLDMENYSDKTYGKLGANWVDRSGSTDWTDVGGDYHTDASSSFTQSFTTGRENLEIDITTLVEQWVNSGGNVLGSKSNYGVGVYLSDTFESASQSYYTKKFFARGSQYFHKRPVLEARWDSSRRDDRGSFYFSSSIAPGYANLNTLYLYNYVRGRLRDIADSDSAVPTMKLYYASGSLPEGSTQGFLNSSNTAVASLSAARLSKGVYYTQFAVTKSAVTSTYPYLVDVWEYDSEEFFTGSAITPKKHTLSVHNMNQKYFINIPNLKDSYANDEVARFRLYVRPKDWSPTIYTKAVSTPETTLIPTASYEVRREIDNFKIISYGTGSDMHTVLSHDVSGNYFDLDMSMFEPGYSYSLRFAFYDCGVKDYVHQPYEFKFRVKENVY
jgi:hypothetical protein